jgi:hypothetical protein
VCGQVHYIKNNGYGGAMVWALPLDDFAGNPDFCGKKWPLMNAILDECNA